VSGDDTPPGAAKYTPGQALTAGVLYRRIYPQRTYFNPDTRRPTSQVFDKGTAPHLSTSLQELTFPAKVLEDHAGFGLCEVDVAVVVAQGLTATYDPTPDDPAHVRVEGPLGKRVRRALAEPSRVLVGPTLPP
jgi:hypothetical protein